MNKLKLLEQLIKDNACLWRDGKTVFSKWDQDINWVAGYPLEFQKYIRKLLKEAE